MAVIMAPDIETARRMFIEKFTAQYGDEERAAKEVAGEPEVIDPTQNYCHFTFGGD
jgi:hypothetical protein